MSEIKTQKGEIVLNLGRGRNICAPFTCLSCACLLGYRNARIYACATFIPAVFRPTHELTILVSDRYMAYGAATGVGECLLLEAIKTNVKGKERKTSFSRQKDARM